jgi:glyoxylase-like metal-dependent hydrolase (beta-lactamase superfamily II)
MTPRPAATVGEIAPIRLVVAPNPGPFTLEGTNTWIVGSDRTLVLDPGPPDPAHVEAVVRLAGQVEAILLTHHHPDHAPAASMLAERTGAPIRALEPAAGERRLWDGDAVVAGRTVLVAVRTPGHTADHTVFHHQASRSIFTGDAVLGRGTSVVNPPEGDLQAYLGSLRRMLDLRPATLYPGHGPEVRDGVRKLEEYLRHRQTRERQVLAGMSGGPRSAAELVPAIYGEYPPALHQAAARSVLAHLLKLEGEGRVVRIEGSDGDRFELVRASEPRV